MNQGQFCAAPFGCLCFCGLLVAFLAETKKESAGVTAGDCVQVKPKVALATCTKGHPAQHQDVLWVAYGEVANTEVKPGRTVKVSLGANLLRCPPERLREWLFWHLAKAG